MQYDHSLQISHSKSDRVKIHSSNILPNVLKESFQSYIEIAAAFEHTDNKLATDEQQANSRHTASFLDEIDNAPYLLRSMVTGTYAISFYGMIDTWTSMMMKR